MSEDAARDDKLRGLLGVMVARIPADKRITTGVVLQLLRAKYSQDYPESYLAHRESFITTTLEQLLRARSGTVESATATDGTPHDATSDSSDDTESSSGAEEEDEDEEDEEEDDEEEQDEEEDDDVESSEELGSEATSHKRARDDADDAFTHTATQDDAAVAARCKAMVSCLQKLGYRPRLPEKNAVLHDYLENYLKPEFAKHGLDPARYTAHDVRRYKALKEVEQLQQDGAVLQLDRRQRAGRGYAHVTLQPAAPGEGSEALPKAPYTTPRFLDDDEE